MNPNFEERVLAILMADGIDIYERMSMIVEAAVKCGLGKDNPEAWDSHDPWLVPKKKRPS